MKVDVSEYIIDAFKHKWENSSFERIHDDEDTPILLVNLKGMESFEIDLEEAEHLLIEENIDLDDYVLSVIHAAKFISEEGDTEEGTFVQIAKAMDMVLVFLLASGIDHTVGSCVEAEDEENMCSGIWINIGIHPVPFLFKECWENLIRDEVSVDEFVKDIIIKHVGRMP